MTLPETRCIHGMLEWPADEQAGRPAKSSCSICRGLEYDFGSPLAEFEPKLADEAPAPTLRWFTLEDSGVCTVCEARLREGQQAAVWLQGVIGRCCEEQVA